MAARFNNIGGVYHSQGQQDKALEYLQKALPIREEVGDRAGESDTRYNLAMVHYSQGKLREAAAELRRVVELDKLVQRPGLDADRAALAQIENELAEQGVEPGL